MTPQLVDNQKQRQKRSFVPPLVMGASDTRPVRSRQTRHGSHPVPMSIGRRIHRLRRDAGLSQSALGHRVGVRQNTISSWEQDRTSPDTEAVRTLARIFSVSPAWIEFGIGADQTVTGKPGLKEKAPFQVPLISWVQAGELADIEDPYPKGDGSDVLNFTWSHGQLIALQVKGTSMNRISPEGSVIIVDLRDRQPKPGKHYIVKVDGQSTFKTYRTNPARLEPHSTESHESIPLSGREVTIVGRVVRTYLDLS